MKSDERGSGFRRRRKRQTQPPVSDVQNELIHQLTRSYKDLLKQYNHARESQQKLAEELRRGLGSFGTDHIASRIETLETHLREEVEKLNENLIMRLEYPFLTFFFLVFFLLVFCHFRFLVVWRIVLISVFRISLTVSLSLSVLFLSFILFDYFRVYACGESARSSWTDST